jgi:uncharacterized LabA/DUF88 family protein
VDGFCLVTSDSDFTRLAMRLREANMYVIGKITQEKELYNFGKYKYVVTNLKGNVSKSDNQ